jgi:AcrR family transcriptional regulator
MAVTERVIGRHGPVGLTLASIAGEAGLTPPALVRRFGSKRGLLLAFARHGSDAVPAAFARARRAHDSPLSAMYAALAELSAGMGTPAEVANHLGVLQLDLTDEQFRDHAASHARRVRDELVALLREAVTAGELTDRVDTARLARSVHVAYNGVLILYAVTREETLADALRGELDELLRPHRMPTRRRTTRR